jgi:hypothetical protein
MGLGKVVVEEEREVFRFSSSLPLCAAAVCYLLYL